jgi:hypothetical protein
LASSLCYRRLSGAFNPRLHLKSGQKENRAWTFGFVTSQATQQTTQHNAEWMPEKKIDGLCQGQLDPIFVARIGDNMATRRRAAAP